MSEHLDPLPERNLENPQEAVAAAVELIGSARRSLYFFCSLLPPALFNATEFNDALRSQLIHETRLRCFMLMQPIASWRQVCPQLSQLIERLSTLELRITHADEPRDKAEFGQVFLIADSKVVLLLKDPRRCIGQFCSDDALQVRKLLSFFNPLWEKSQVDIELRRLGI